MTSVPKVNMFRRLVKYFLIGLAFETVLISLAVILPESWLRTEIGNVALLIHLPLFVIMSALRLDESWPWAVAGLIVMVMIWGFLISLAGRGVRRLLSRLNLKQKRIVSIGAGVLGLVVMVWGLFNLPAWPRPFTASPEVAAVVTANNAFALDLYQQLKTKPGNLFFSPYAVSASLALAGAGANGQTRAEFTNTLRLAVPPEQVPGAFKALAGRMSAVERWNRITLQAASAIWYRKDYPLKESFLKLVREGFGAEASALDFNQPEAAAAKINRWVAQQTHGKITGIATPEQFTSDSALVLASAIYFKGKWHTPFPVKNTQPQPFYVTTNETVTVPMMQQTKPVKSVLSEDQSVDLLELPYIGRDLSMIILLPVTPVYQEEDDAPNDLAALEQKLTPDNLRVWLAKLDQTWPHETSVSLPRFTTTSSFSLTNELKALGLASAFSRKADFSGMDGTTYLYLTDVLQKTFVEVKESGTEAAAVNLMQAKTKGMDGRFRVDHPFLYLIRENGSGSILFLGRMTDPTK